MEKKLPSAKETLGKKSSIVIASLALAGVLLTVSAKQIDTGHRGVRT